jgi:hypothetical protein
MKLYLKISLMLLVIVSWFGLSIHTVSKSHADLNDRCQTKPLQELGLVGETGELIYQPVSGEDELITNSIRSIQLPLHPQTLQLSPNGFYIAGEYIRDGDPNIHPVAILNHSEELIYLGAQSKANILKIQWLGNERLLSFVQIPSGSEAAVAYFVIDPFNREYTYFQPSRTPPFYYELPDRIVPIGGYEFTYDGRYLFSGRQPMYDFELDQPLLLENLPEGVPALNSHRLIGVDYEAYRNEGFYPVYIYDFDTDDIIQPISFQPSSEISGNYSWSPNEALFAYTLYYSNEDLDSFRRLELLDLDSGDIRPTCFGLKPIIGGEGELQFVRGFSSPDFAWSRDSRYLAMQGVLEGQDMEESLGVYIYDTQTDDIYLVHHGRADIIGWMASPDQEADTGG